MTQRRIYQNLFPYFITSNIEGGFWFFDEEKFAWLLYEIILKACRMKSFILYAFCILPNHFHLLVKQRPGATTDPPDCLATTRRAGGCVVRGEIFSTTTAQASAPALDKRLPALNNKLPALGKKSPTLNNK